MKRFIDILFSLCALILLSPVLSIFILLIFFQDFRTPFFIARRVGKDFKPFKMVKLRSMVIDAHRKGSSSTALDDERITFVGNFIRRYKIDELLQFWNVLLGQMSLVGPRPNLEKDVLELYSKEEKKLLCIRPGMTDFASIIFSDEGDILEGSKKPDLLYNQIIRPWKSRLGLIYVENRTFFLDIKILWITSISLFSRNTALIYSRNVLVGLKATREIIEVAERKKSLKPFPPPGMTEIVLSC